MLIGRPMALFAIRQVPNRDVGYSPHQLVFGRNVIGPLDLLVSGWVDESFEQFDLAVTEESSNTEKRCLSFNRNKSDRSGGGIKSLTEDPRHACIATGLVGGPVCGE